MLQVPLETGGILDPPLDYGARSVNNPLGGTTTSASASRRGSAIPRRREIVVVPADRPTTA